VSAVITITETGGLGPIELELPPGKLSITPASRLCLEAIGQNRELLSGAGIDWGSGSGCLAIAAARIPAVERIVGIEVSGTDVAAANRNATRNGVGGRVTIIEADLYEPVSNDDKALLDGLVGRCDFLIGNPPATPGNDGLGWRRAVLGGARRFLIRGGPVLMQVSYQYGERIRRLSEDVPGYSYEGVLATTEWVPFDQDREDLARNLDDYADEEVRSGLPYRFGSGAGDPGERLTATQALARARATGESPMSRWQVHLFRWGG